MRRRIGSRIGLYSSSNVCMDRCLDRSRRIRISIGPRIGPDRTALLIKGENHFLVIPFIWADTKTTNLENDFKAITAKIEDEVREKPLRDQIEHVKQKLESEQRAHALMKHYKLSKKAKLHFEDLNDAVKSRKKQRDRLWDYSTIEEQGYFGFHMLDANPDDNDWNVTSVEEGTPIGVENLDSPVTHLQMLQFWAYSMWLFEASKETGMLNTDLLPPSFNQSQ